MLGKRAGQEGKPASANPWLRSASNRELSQEWERGRGEGKVERRR